MARFRRPPSAVSHRPRPRRTAPDGDCQPSPWPVSDRSRPGRPAPWRHHFSTGTTMPRMITFWQSVKTRKVGTAATTREAKTMPWPLRIWSW